MAIKSVVTDGFETGGTIGLFLLEGFGQAAAGPATGYHDNRRRRTFAALFRALIGGNRV